MGTRYVPLEEARAALEHYDRINVVARAERYADGQRYKIFIYPKALDGIVFTEEVNDLNLEYSDGRVDVRRLKALLEKEAQKSVLVTSSIEGLTPGSFRILNEKEKTTLSDIVSIR